MRENRDFVVPVNILTPFARAPFSWAARHTTVCLDIGGTGLPEVTVTPSSQIVEVTHTAVFTTTVNGVGSSSFTYQWRIRRGHHHQIIKGETRSILKVDKVSGKDQGQYSCYVENIYGDSAVSTSVHLTVASKNCIGNSMLILH